MSKQTPEDSGILSPLNPLGTEEGQLLLARQKKNTAILWGITALLLLLAVGVFLLLPQLVSLPTLEEPVTVVATAAPGSTATSPGTIQALSPFEEAQRLRQREAAQEVLSAILDLQETLEGREVDTWASEAYTRALDLARNGDENYRQQLFSKATESYRQALDALQTLEANIPGLLETLLVDGNAALAAGDSSAALDSFQQALALDATSDGAIDGIERARVLDQVMELSRSARAAAENGDLGAALELYREAVALDPQHQPASQGISDTSAAIQERDFRRHMSEGYAALQDAKPSAARAAFNRALGLRPGSPEAVTALEQVSSQEALDAISSHMAQARAMVREEQWQQALAAWNQSLTIDPALQEAIAGRNEAQSRLNLDNYLSSLIADPLTLADDTVYQRSIEVYTSALRIPDGGPRLREQMHQAREFLDRARTPLDVMFESDGLSTVTLLRIQDLGQFANTTVPLIPGRYAATAFRTGYKDVRVEFEVGFDGPPAAVVIAANESIR